MAKSRDMVEEAREEEKEGGGDKDDGMKRGGRTKRRKGGFVPGKMSGMRPDRRARGGATSDKNPFTAAGHMTEPGARGSEATGGDKSPYGGGSHRRPG